MRSAVAAILLALLATLVPALLPSPAAAKTFVFSSVEVDATVGTDGALRIVERRTYRFDGTFSWASYRLPLTGTSGIRQIRVADERGPYRHGPAPARGVYHVSQDGRDVVIRWGFAAEDESRTFTISYLLDDVVTVYRDVAELYWKFVGAGWDRPSEQVRVRVRLPGNVPASRVRAWGHGPLQGDVGPVAGGAVLSVTNLPAHTMVEGRIVFPREVVPGARQRIDRDGLPTILREEEAWAAAANRRRLLARLGMGAGVAFAVLAIGLWFLLYVRYGREPEPSAPAEYYRELPGTYTPAELGVLWRFGAVQPADFVATVMDLVRRGYLAIESGESDWWGRTTYTIVRLDRRDGLQTFEREALAMLFGDDDRSGARVAVERGGLPGEVKTRIGKRFSAWSRQVSSAARRYRFFDDRSAHVSGATLGAGILLFVAAWFVGGTFHSLSAVGLVLAGIVLAAGSGALKRRSQRGADDLRRWQGFRRFLLDFSEMPRAELPAVALWEHYLVYAIPLGVADQVIRQLGKVYTSEELAAAPTLRAWTGASSDARGSPGLAALSSFTTALTAATSSASSGSGRGGGFSGGGGGGGGGSGGSAG